MHRQRARRFDDAAHLGSIIALAGSCRQSEATGSRTLGSNADPNRLRLTRGVLHVGGESTLSILRC